MPENYNWIRYWCPIDEPYYIDRNGYLIDPSYSDFSANSHLIENPFQRSENCIILLGEPGIGKTTEMEKFYQDVQENLEMNEGEVLFIRLEQFGNEIRLINEVFQNPTIQRWLENDIYFIYY